jgi:hypothetical protein
MMHANPIALRFAAHLTLLALYRPRFSAGHNQRVSSTMMAATITIAHRESRQREGFMRVTIISHLRRAAG